MSSMPSKENGIGKMGRQTNGCFPVRRASQNCADIPLLVLAKGNVSQRPPRTLPNAGYEFVDVHQPTGKVDPTSVARIRAYNMRKYHQNRRKPPETSVIRPDNGRCASNEIGTRHCSPGQHHHFRLVNPGPHSPSPLSSDPHIDRSPHILRNSNTSGDYITPDDDSMILSTRLLVCSNCGTLSLRYRPSRGDLTLVHSLSEPPTSLTGGSDDPFDSFAMTIDHRMHGLIHHCESEVT